MNFPLLSKQKVLILGANGQVGRNLRKLLPTAIPLDRSKADLSKPESLIKVLNDLKPQVVINAAAYTAVDLAEKEQDLARTINAKAPESLAQWCADHDAAFVHYSTDYVFPGTGLKEWVENDAPKPLNTYGQTKLEGEQAVLKSFYRRGLDDARFFIFRTSWVFDTEGKNFVLTMLKLGADRESLKVVSDQVGAPTFAKDIAKHTLEALEMGLKQKPFPSGVYHFCQTGQTNWYQFAEAIFMEARELGLPVKVTKVEPISTLDYPTPAKRPYNSRMDTSKLFDRFQIQFRGWRLALKECMKEIAERNTR